MSLYRPYRTKEILKVNKADIIDNAIQELQDGSYFQHSNKKYLCIFNQWQSVTIIRLKIVDNRPPVDFLQIFSNAKEIITIFWESMQSGLIGKSFLFFSVT